MKHTHTYTHTHTAANIMNWAFQTEFCMFKVNNLFNVIMSLTSHPVEAYKKRPKHTEKQKQNGSLGAFFTYSSKWPQDLEKTEFRVFT